MSRIIYHGTIACFTEPSLYFCKERKDFGRGFYLSDNINQSKGIADKQLMMHSANNSKFIYSYRIDINDMRSKIDVHEFRDASIAWIDYVIKNRCKINNIDKYDVVIGPTADRNAYMIIDEFYERYGDNASDFLKNELIKNIDCHRYGIQYCFKTDKALKYLCKHFLERRSYK